MPGLRRVRGERGVLQQYEESPSILKILCSRRLLHTRVLDRAARIGALQYCGGLSCTTATSMPGMARSKCTVTVCFSSTFFFRESGPVIGMTCRDYKV